MAIGLDRRPMIEIVPERAFALLALVVLLGGTTSNELHGVGNHLCTGVSDQQVNVVRVTTQSNSCNPKRFLAPDSQRR